MQGLFDFIQQTPVDFLRAALHEGGPDGKATAELLRDFGQTELLVLALHILTSDIPQDTKLRDRVVSNILRFHVVVQVASLFYSLKDVPTSETMDGINNLAYSPNGNDSLSEWGQRIRCK